MLSKRKILGILVSFLILISSYFIILQQNYIPDPEVSPFLNTSIVDLGPIEEKRFPILIPNDDTTLNFSCETEANLFDFRIINSMTHGTFYYITNISVLDRMVSFKSGEYELLFANENVPFCYITINVEINKVTYFEQKRATPIYYIIPSLLIIAILGFTWSNLKIVNTQKSDPQLDSLTKTIDDQFDSWEDAGRNKK